MFLLRYLTDKTTDTEHRGCDTFLLRYRQIRRHIQNSEDTDMFLLRDLTDKTTDTEHRGYDMFLLRYLTVTDIRWQIQNTRTRSVLAQIPVSDWKTTNRGSKDMTDNISNTKATIRYNFLIFFFTTQDLKIWTVIFLAQFCRTTISEQSLTGINGWKILSRTASQGENF